MQNFLLYAATVLIWGSTWLAIKFQLGVVDHLLSVCYRFGIAAAMLLVFCAATRRLQTLKSFTRLQHGFMALQGFCLFCLNYALIYQGTAYLTTGLVAVCFSTIAIMNVFNQRIFLGGVFEIRTLFASLVGLAGIVCMFWPEIEKISDPYPVLLGGAYCLLSAYSASLGNILSFRNSSDGMPVIETTMLGMAYGTVFSLILALTQGTALRFDPSFPYVASLLYLSFFGSVLGFGCFLTLVQRIGAGKAGYSAILFPVIALALSTLFEHYIWTFPSVIGALLILGGNVLAMKKTPSLK